MKRTFLSFAAICLGLTSFAQGNVSSAAIYLGLRKLNVLGSVLYVAAHPDDENTRLLTYLSKDGLYRTGYLSLTRGDGGQNLIGDEQGIELGLIRTQELLAARKIDGAEQFFTRAYDFGFSKTPAETFNKWDKEKILADVVFVIRKFQPDVIITRFPTTGEGGHGHHTASAILANEAYAAAADPKRFPEQLQYVQPWQAKRVLWNTFNFGGNNTTSNDQFKIDVGAYNPVLGKSYGEIAAESRSQHKSQGFGVPRGRGEALEYFRTTAGAAPGNSLFDEVSTGWKRVKGGSAVESMVAKAIQEFDFLKPQASVPALLQIHKAIRSLPEGYWRTQKLKEVKDLIEAASGVWVDAFTPQQYAVQGDSVRLQFSFNNRLSVRATVSSISVEGFDTTVRYPLSPNVNYGIAVTRYVRESVPVSQPYWLENGLPDGYFNVTEQSSIGAPEIVSSYLARIRMNIEGEEFEFVKPVQYRFTDPVRGELYEPLVIVPPVVLQPDAGIKMSKGNNRFEGELVATAKRKGVTAIVKGIGTKEKDQVQQSFTPSSVVFGGANNSRTIRYQLEGSKDNDYRLFLQADSSMRNIYGSQMHTIRYDHIPYISYYTDVVVKNRKLDVATRGKRIGYIVGAGDKVPEALEQMGYEVVMLGDKELSRNGLQQFDAIISGVRAYNTNEWLNNHYEKLMDYVARGGNLIVQYNTSNQIGPVRAKIGPYSFNITRNRITDENAKVNFLKPDHPVLNYPNKITEEDFRGWVQERSIYHAGAVDSNFQSILRMADPGEGADDGSLVIAPYGKGFFTYTGLVFFRELPAGVPGAYRLMANLIALNAKKEF